MWNPFDRKRDASAAVDALPPMPEPSVCPRTISDIAEVKNVGGVAVATLTTTELTQEDGADQLASLLLELAETGATHFVLDVQNVQYMDTACLGCLVQALNNLAARGGRIALCSLNLNVQSVFKLTRLDRVFPIRSDVMSALEAVEGREQD